MVTSTAWIHTCEDTLPICVPSCYHWTSEECCRTIQRGWAAQEHIQQRRKGVDNRDIERPRL